MPLPPPIRVVGVGSAQGDDAVAWEVVRLLRERAAAYPGVDFYRVGGGQGLLALLDGLGTVLVLDAIRTGAAPGTIYRSHWPDPRIDSDRPGSTHSLRVAEALQLAASVGLLPAQVVLYGVELHSLQPGAGLTAEVSAAVSELVRQIEAELHG